MKKWTQLTLLSIALAGLGACSSDNKTATSGDAQTESSAQASDKLQSKFVNIATGGASAPCNVININLLFEIYNKTYTLYPNYRQILTSKPQA